MVESHSVFEAVRWIVFIMAAVLTSENEYIVLVCSIYLGSIKKKILTSLSLAL